MDRYARLSADQVIRTNAEANGTLLEEVAEPGEAGQRLLTEATEKMRLSARGYHRVLRVARTHVAEALSFRRIAPSRFA
jgi:magnesium chelatase family protein